MGKYTKYEGLKLTMFWSLVVAIVLFIIDSILAIANVSRDGVIAVFVLAIVATIISFSVWLYIKVKRTNRQLTQ